MMRDAETTWALVVGIDDYMSVNKLTGAAQDAVDVVGWLRRLGVPDTNILLHAAPAEPTKAAVGGLGLDVRGCREPELWESFRALSKQKGSKLLVFLMGHGLFEPAGHRVFLTQEADQEVVRNLGIDWYTAYLRGAAFADQYVVMDGCLNLPYTAAQRAVFTAGEQAGVALPPPRGDDRQVFCFSAQQGEKAIEVDGHGIFTQALLRTLDPEQPDQGCVDLDDESGVVRLDLARAVNDIVSPQVTAKAPRQHPGLQALGAVRTGTVLPIVELVPEKTATVRVSVAPDDALLGVRRISLWSDSNDWRSNRPRPPETTIPASFETVVPDGLEVVARCAVVQGGTWAQPEQQEFVASGTHDVVFELTGAAPMAPEVHEVVLDALTPDGDAAEAMSTPAKEAITRALEEQDISFAFDPASDADVTVDIQRHGPILRSRGGRGVSFDVLSTRVARELDLALPPRVSIRMRPRNPAGAPRPTAPKPAAEERATTLRFALDHAQAVRLAGFLLDAPVVTVRDDTWTLRRLVAAQALELDPGPATIRVDLPWGTWSTRERLKAGRATTVTLPEQVGTPPLRVSRLRRGVDPDMSAPDAPAGERRTLLTPSSRSTPRLVEPDGTAGGELVRAEPSQLFTGVAWQPAPGAASSWRSFVEVPTARGSFVTVLDELGPLALELGATPRVEPLSLVPSPEWDALLSAGRLEDADRNSSVALTFEKWGDPVLGLAGAYGCLAHAQAKFLEKVLANLEGVLKTHPDLPDLAVLHGALDRLQDRHRTETKKRLERMQRTKAVPVLRWGVVFGQIAADHYGLKALSRRLADLEERLEPASTWTLWRAS